MKAIQTNGEVSSGGISPPCLRRIISRQAFLRLGLGAMTIPVLPACGLLTPREDPVPERRLSARPRPPTESPRLGLTRLGISRGRDGWIYVPRGHSPETPAPLFVALHGAGGRGEFWDSYQRLAEERAMIVLAPDSRSTRSWDLIAGGRVGPDARFLDQALRRTFTMCRIDPSRIALGGFSDGASYALSIGVSNGHLFRHLVAYSPGFIWAADPLVGKPAIFVSHGTHDQVLPVAETRTRMVPSLREAGFEVRYEEFDGGHSIPASISEMALNWFLG